jgi:hypothetical protein
MAHLAKQLGVSDLMLGKLYKEKMVLNLHYGFDEVTTDAVKTVVKDLVKREEDSYLKIMQPGSVFTPALALTVH